MSNPEDRNRPEGESVPQFGQPSEGGPSTPEDSRAERPWPVYGAEQAPGQVPPPVTGADWGQPQVPPGYGQAGPGAYGQASNQGAPGATGYPQYPQSPGGPGPYSAGPAPVPANLPSRTGAIVTMVLGGVVAVIVAPVVFFAVTMSGVDVDSFARSSVVNGSTVTVDDSGKIAVLSESGGGLNQCTISDGSTSIDLYEDGSSGIVSGTNVPQGTYTIQCDIPDGRLLFVFRGDEVSALLNSTFSGLLWGTVLGIGGLAAFIVGIVWLVKRNRQRSDAIRNQWYQGRM